MPQIADVFSNKSLLAFVENLEPQSYVGEMLFPEEKQPELDFRMIMGASNLPVAAAVHAFDTESVIRQREISTQDISLLLIKNQIQLKEKDLIVIGMPTYDARTKQAIKYVYNDVKNMVEGVRSRIEAMRMEALATGKVTIKENNLNLTIDYQVPAENQETLSGTGLWSNAASKPLEDIQRWNLALDTPATRAITTNKVLMALLNNPSVQLAVTGVTGKVPTRVELNNYLGAQGLPQIASYDDKYRFLKSDGTYEKRRYFPENHFTMIPDGDMGTTLYGPTAEERRILEDPSVDVSMVGNILAMVFERDLDPVGTWTKAVATAVPAFTQAHNVFQAVVTEG